MAWDGVPVIELVLGRHGLAVRRNGNLLPLGSFKKLRNATLEDDSVRTAAGATPLGAAIGALTIQAGIDYWSDLSTQRTVVALSDGSIRKDDGTGNSWATLASGLSTTGTVPFFAIGGRELVNRNRKLFYCDRVNAVQVLAADGASTAALARPPADWNGTNQPAWLAPHERWLFGGGNANAPKMIYRNWSDDHEDFLSFPWFYHVAGDYERLTAGLSFKGGLLVWGYPRGVWFLDTQDLDDKRWRAVRVGQAGAAGPACVVRIENDVLWVAPDGSLHLISATNATGSARAQDIAWAQLGTFLIDNLNLAQLATAQWVYYGHKQKALLACHGLGGTIKNRCVEFDVSRTQDLGGRYIFHDRHRNEALFLRKVLEIETPHFGDAAGQVWTMDRAARSDNGAGYTFEWRTNDIDLSAAIPRWAGRLKNGRFIQLEYDPRSSGTHTIDIYRDGVVRQQVTFTLSAGPTTLPATLPFTLNDAVLTMTRPKPLLGQARRWAFGGVSSVSGMDVSVTKLVLGFESAE